MFTGFSEAAQEFLWGIRMNNERPWFLAHKQEYIDHVQTPLNDLAKEVFDRFNGKHGKLGMELHVSRIYRDARRLHGRGPYKDSLWLSIRQPKADRWSPRPEFWFGIRPEGYEYGMGMYLTRPITMELLRREIDEDPKRLLALTKKLDKHPALDIDAPTYQRPKGAAPAPLDRWYNRKSLNIDCVRDWDELLMSAALVDTLADDFDFLVPYYTYFRELCIRSETEL